MTDARFESVEEADIALLGLMRDTSKMVARPHVVLIENADSHNVRGFGNAPVPLIMAWSFHLLVDTLSGCGYPEVAKALDGLMDAVFDDMDRRSKAWLS